MAGDMMGEGLGMEEAPDAEATEETASVQIPKSIIGDQEVKPGDVVRLEVVSVDDDNGMLNVKYAEPKEEAPPEEGPTISSMAAKFEK